MIKTIINNIKWKVARATVLDARQSRADTVAKIRFSTLSSVAAELRMPDVYVGSYKNVIEGRRVDGEFAHGSTLETFRHYDADDIADSFRDELIAAMRREITYYANSDDRMLLLVHSDRDMVRMYEKLERL